MLENVQEQNVKKCDTPQKWVLKNKLRQIHGKISQSSSNFTPDSGVNMLKLYVYLTCRKKSINFDICPFHNIYVSLLSRKYKKTS